MPRKRLISLAVLFALLGAWSLAAAPARADSPNPAQAVLRATVTVEAESGAAEDAKQDPSSAKRVLAVASGTVVGPEGLIVSFQLPEQESAAFFVRVQGKRLPAKLLVSDRRSGLRLLQAEACDAPHLPIAEQPAEVGQRVLAAVVYQGRAVRYVRPSSPVILAAGIVTATGRRTDGVAIELLQTDIPAGPGSAGAPLADEQGRLLGILMAVDVSQEEKITLAIPARYVSELLKIERGEKPVVIQPAYLGVQLASDADVEGAKVAQVLDDSPAAKVELNPGDVIVAVNGQQVLGADDLTALVAQQTAGARVTLRVKRGDGALEIEAALVERPIAPTSQRVEKGYGAGAEGYESMEEGYELGYPGEYRVVPLKVDDDSAIDAETLRRVTEFLQPYRAAPSNQKPAVPWRLAEPKADDLTPLTIYVQRSEADQRLDRLTGEVKSLREDVKKLAEQLEALSNRLEKPSEPMTREQALQSLRDEFLKKLDDLVRQSEEAKRK
jgi:S1-C subfamily serine protease